MREHVQVEEGSEQVFQQEGYVMLGLALAHIFSGLSFVLRSDETSRC